jgi:hypothetical protein
MTTATSVKTCLACDKAIRGRTDKKFCDDYCRNHYNNQLNGGDNNFMRNINSVLRRNRRILADLLPDEEEMAKASRDRLLQVGFNFKYLTHTFTNKKGNVYYFCYDLGYLPLEGNWYLLVRRREK